MPEYLLTESLYLELFFLWQKPCKKTLTGKVKNWSPEN